MNVYQAGRAEGLRRGSPEMRAMVPGAGLMADRFLSLDDAGLDSVAEDMSEGVLLLGGDAGEKIAQVQFHRILFREIAAHLEAAGDQLVHAIHVAQDTLERPRLVAALRLDRVAVHRIAGPDHLAPLALDRAELRTGFGAGASGSTRSSVAKSCIVVWLRIASSIWASVELRTRKASPAGRRSMQRRPGLRLNRPRLARADCCPLTSPMHS